MRVFNEWANSLPRSYVSQANAVKAWEKTESPEGDSKGGVIFYHRKDGRWSVVIINPDAMFVSYYIHTCCFGVWGVSN